MAYDPFAARAEFSPAPGKKGILYSLATLEKAGLGRVSRLPVSLRIVLESVLRNANLAFQRIIERMVVPA